MMKKSKKQLINGVLWWKPEQWEKARKVCLNGDDFFETYLEWEIRAEKTIKQLREHRLKVVKVEIDLNELVAWCKQENKPLGGKARSEFVS